MLNPEEEIPYEKLYDAYTRQRLQAREKLYDCIKEADDPNAVERIMVENDIGINDIVSPRPSGWEVSLHHAIQYERYGVLEYLLQQPGIKLVVDVGVPSKFSFVRDAVQRNDPTALELLLRHPDVDVNKSYCHYHNGPPLAEAYSECFQLLLQHPKIDVNQKIGYYNVERSCVSLGGHPQTEELEHYNILHATIVLKGEAAVRELLKHPDLELNGVEVVCDQNGSEEEGRPVLFYIFSPFGFRIHGDDDFLFDDLHFDYDVWNTLIDGLHAFLEDHRVSLGIRDREGRSLKDFIPEEVKRYYYEKSIEDEEVQEDEEDRVARESLCVERLLEVVEYHEERRLHVAKNQINILKDWNVPKPDGTERFLPDALFSTYLFPFVADIISPIEELEDAPTGADLTQEGRGQNMSEDITLTCIRDGQEHTLIIDGQTGETKSKHVQALGK